MGLSPSRNGDEHETQFEQVPQYNIPSSITRRGSPLKLKDEKLNKERKSSYLSMVAGN
jgi:hypothetical protein